MDVNDLRGLATITMAVVFTGIIIWTFSSRRKKPFDEAANLPFADKDEEDLASSDKKNQE
ncbi:cbb3-type cytochrome oxidase subunit 3 [Litoribrevibacter euphylliae]|uniref:Cbb3-type cytochrome oxidase subunit 3 n=1 Tax=Litoribrevibacter euphylliae TaxID=1834034 RepID=A0ABV7HEN1_9GAMM